MTNEQTELMVYLLKETLGNLIEKADEELGISEPIRKDNWEYIGKDPFGIMCFLAANKSKEDYPDLWKKTKGKAIVLDCLRELINKIDEPFKNGIQFAED